jgi:hypothetical protein
MNPPRNISTARAWWRSLFRASPAYWLIQSAVGLGSILISAGLLSRVSGPEGAASQGWLLRMTLETAVFFLVTHVGLRPALRIYFLGTLPRWPAWLALALWMLALALASIAISFGIDRLGLVESGAITAVRFSAGSSEFGVDITGLRFYVLATANLSGTLAVWAALYLGWHALQQRRRLQQQVRQARLDQLTRQLNPHFLFNAFNTIRGTIFENPQRAADLVTELSELFRFHLSQAERRTQTLEEEWRLAQRYLAIEQARLEQRLYIDVQLDPVCLPKPLPSLALLTLVENAIKHGIAPRADGGVLRIRARPQVDGWQLEVANPLAAGERRDGTRIGLSNLRERLELGFGSRAQLEAGIERGIQGEEFRVRISLPW